jgi:predicted O-methyltransferase YrrM
MPAPWRAIDKAPFRRQTYTLFGNLLRVEPTFWRQNFWSSIRLAREAVRHGALQKIAELAPLLAMLGRRKPVTVLEIGTASGGTLYAWCRVAASDATIVSVDLPGGPFGGGYSEEDAERIQEHARPGQTLHLLRLDSHDIATRDEVIARLSDRPLDFLMIDGDHRYEGVRQDFEMYAPLVGSNGVIAFHDVVANPTLAEDQVGEVHLFWKEIKGRYKHLELLAPGDDRGWGGRWGGIGVLFSPGENT